MENLAEQVATPDIATQEIILNLLNKMANGERVIIDENTELRMFPSQDQWIIGIPNTTGKIIRTREPGVITYEINDSYKLVLETRSHSYGYIKEKGLIIVSIPQKNTSAKVLDIENNIVAEAQIQNEDIQQTESIESTQVEINNNNETFPIGTRVSLKVGEKTLTGNVVEIFELGVKVSQTNGASTSPLDTFFIPFEQAQKWQDEGYLEILEPSEAEA